MNYKKVILIYTDYSGNGTSGVIESSIEHEFEIIKLVPNLNALRSATLSIKEFNIQYAYILSVLPCFAQLDGVDIVGIGLQGAEQADCIDQSLTESFAALDSETCVIMLTDFTQEVEDPIMGVYFESIIQSLGRKPRAVQFSTDVGDMLIQVA